MTGHLIHIGYPKTGTNSLRHWFAQHPQLTYAEGGIAGFQDVYSIVRYAAQQQPPPLYRVTSAEGFATPHVSFGLARTDLEAARRLPMALIQMEVCDLLAELFPDARILLVTRGFRATALSTYSQTVRQGSHFSIADHCNGGSEQSDAQSDDPLIYAAYNYDALIQKYRQAFGSENVIVLPYELLCDDPARFLRGITEPLGLDEVPLPMKRANPSLSAIELAWYPRLSRAVRALPLPPALRRLAEIIFQRASFANRLRWLIFVLQRLHPLPPITESDVTDDMIASWVFPPETLRNDPLYRPYLREYYLDREAR